MEKKVIDYINSYESIIISRHKNPDLDAYGSQFGLYYALKSFYPNKTFYVVGDTNQLNEFRDFDDLSETVVKSSLLFILDTVSDQMLLNQLYKDAGNVILFDHHQNQPDIRFDLYIRNVEASSTSEMITSFLLENSIPIPKESAKALFMGIVGDTGRFMYSSTSHNTFRCVATLLETGIDISKIYNKMYTETLESKRVKAAFFHTIQLTKNHVGYRKNDTQFLEEYHLDFNYVSRGLVSQMAGIIEIPIWVNFTIDPVSNQIFCELRSREIPVLEVAKKHGGGGHLLACGCRVSTWEETDEILNELDKLLEENHG